MECETLNEFLGYSLDQKTTIEETTFWSSVMSILKVPEQAAILHLYTSEEFALKVLRFLLKLPYNTHSAAIIGLISKRLDPSSSFIRNVVQELVGSLETDTPCLSSLNTCLTALKCVFENQTPLNEHLISSVQLYGPEDGMEVKESMKWPFQKGGTFAFWYRMREPTKDCKILEIMSEDRAGIEIVMKNRKLYIQKLEEQAKFRLIKNTSTFLCEAVFDVDVKLCIQFQMKKKFFQPQFIINVIMNNFVLNGVELDSFPIGKKPFQITLFKNFHGLFYSCLFLTQKIAQQVQELNNQRGFVDENDIRNFTYLFEDHGPNILMLLTAIRGETQYEVLGPQSPGLHIQDELKEPKEVPRPLRTILFDAINEHECIIGPKAARDYKASIRKEIGNYGGFDCLLPFLDLLELCRCQDDLYSEALKNYLTLIKFVFLNRSDSIERAYQIHYFKILAGFLNRTSLQGFSYQTISKLKEIHISLNTRSLRQKYLRQLVWGLNFGCLEGQNLEHYIRFIKTFYNEDIQTSLQAFRISSILNFIFRELDSSNCCPTHSRQPGHRIKQYKLLLDSILQIIQNILLIKRVDEDLPVHIREIFVIFGYSISSCFSEAVVKLIEDSLQKDSIVYKAFSEAVLDDNSDCKLYLYKALSCCSSWNTKGRLIQLIFKMLGIRMFDETTREKQMLTLCARYPTMNLIKSSSIKSQENKDSIDFSEQKLSLNSANTNKLITISPIETDGLLLLDDPSVFDVISLWTFSEEVLSHVSDQVENPGLLILMELYKSSTYSLRMKISQLIMQNIGVVRFSPELMSWAIQCLLIAEFDSHQSEISKHTAQQIKNTQANFYETISKYQVDDEDKNNQLSIIKLVFSSVKSKYPDDITKVAGNKIFFSICLCKIEAFIALLQTQPETSDKQQMPDPEIYAQLQNKVISNVFTFISQYFILKGDDEDMDFEEELMEVAQEQMQTILCILEKVLEILLIVAVPGDKKIIDQSNTDNNKKMCGLLFPTAEKDKERANFMALLLTCVHNTFDFFEDMDVELKKKNLLLLKKYLIFMVQVTENSGAAKLDHCQEELRQLFLNSLSFLEYKFHQYYAYPFQRHENVGFQMQNRIRKNIEDLRNTIFLIFTDLIELSQFLDEKGSMEHKSFYELMKPKRKGVQKYGLKHIYPPCWKKADEKIIEFMCLKKETLRREAREKLESHISQKRILGYASNIEKKIAKRIADFVQIERKEAEIKQKKSVNFYKSVQSEKCRIFGECQEELTVFRLRVMDKQKVYFQKQKQAKDKEIRETRFSEKKVWNQNRTYGGFWANKNFYNFAQNQGITYNNDLKHFYSRIRSRRESAFFLMPFIKVKANAKKYKATVNVCEKIYANDIFLQGCITQKAQKKRKTQKIKIGMQFLKVKVLDKLVKTSSSKQSPKSDESQKSSILFENVLWVKPMKISSGYLKIQKNKLSFCHRPAPHFDHLSLLDNGLKNDDRLIREWLLEDVEGYHLKKFLLKPNSVQILFKTGKTLFISFYGCPQSEFETFLQEINKMVPQRPQFTLKCSIRQNLTLHSQLLEQWDKMEITEKWLRYQISNFDYLMCLNMASGRTNNDLNQFPVFPWVFSQYRQTKFKKNQNKFRCFDKNMGLQGSEQRITKFKDLHRNIQEDHPEEFPTPHYFGFHYSNICIILQYLVRMNPYSQGAKRLQGGKFDIPDRLFSSIPDSHKNAITEMSDVRQLIPQFFYFPEFLINSQEYDLGQLQVGNKKVHNVQLPDGCLNPFDFIELHRQALQSKEVSLNLHKWIDLIFGFKSAGKEADNSMNSYHYLTYDSALPVLEEIKQPQKREAVESQMAFYGKTPSQLFTKPHPSRSLQKQTQLEEWLQNKILLKFQENYEEDKKNQAFNNKVILMDYSNQKETFLIVYHDGRGMTFTIKSENLGIPSILKKFEVNYRKFEGMNLIDPSFQKSFPVVSIKAEKIVIGGMWGGKFLVYDIENGAYESLMKHVGTVTAFATSEILQLMWSGSSNGQICKWTCADRIFYLQKVFLHSRINTLFYYDDLRTLLSGSEDGSVGILSIQKMEIIRIIKVSDPVDQVLPIRYPFYTLYIQCRNQQQFCYTLNGTKLEESQMEGITGRPQLFSEKSYKQKVLLQVGENQLVFLKVVDFSIEQKVAYQNLKIAKFQIGKDFLLVACEEGQIYLHVPKEKQQKQTNSSNNNGSNFLKINGLFS